MSLATSLLDTTLDRLVVPGYSKIGYRARSRFWAPDPRPGALRGKTALVTGASSGLGIATAVGLAELGARVHLLVRNKDKGGEAAAEVARHVPDASVHVEQCDVSDLDAVRAFATEFATRVGELHVLVHNAGALPPQRQESAQGHESTLATHVLGPYLMTSLLRPALRAAAPSTVVVVSSGGMYTQKLHLDDPQYRTGTYRGATAYARTKRMQVALTQHCAPILAEDGISLHAMHPGWAGTPGVVDSLPGFNKVLGPILRDAAQGADTTVWLAGTPELPVGKFWHDRAIRPRHYLPVGVDSAADRRALCALVDSLVSPGSSA